MTVENSWIEFEMRIVRDVMAVSKLFEGFLMDGGCWLDAWFSSPPAFNALSFLFDPCQ